VNRRFAGPQVTVLTAETTPEALFELFSGLAENTNSIFGADSSGSQTNFPAVAMATSSREVNKIVAGLLLF